MRAVLGYITTTEDVYRPPYGRKPVTRKRRCVLGGCSNTGEIFRDDTGNRRFLPINVGKIDIEAVRRDKEQLLAEAWHLYKSGVKWHVEEEEDAELFVEIKEQQDAHQNHHPFEGPIRDYLNKITRDFEDRDLIGKEYITIEGLFLDMGIGIQDQPRWSSKVRSIFNQCFWLDMESA